MAVDPNTLTMQQGVTFRCVFKLADDTNIPIPLDGWGARFAIYDRPDGNPLLAVDDTLAGDTLTPGNADIPVEIEPGGALGEIHVRLGADQTGLIDRTAVYSAVIYSQSDPTEIQPVAAGPLAVIQIGADTP